MSHDYFKKTIYYLSYRISNIGDLIVYVLHTHAIVMFENKRKIKSITQSLFFTNFGILVNDGISLVLIWKLWAKYRVDLELQTGDPLILKYPVESNIQCLCFMFQPLEN